MFFYDKNDIKIINGDCIDIMQNLEKESVDMVLTSPPYDNIRNYKGIIWNENIWKKVIFNLYNILKIGGAAVWIVGDETIKGSESGTSFKQALYAKECGFNLHDTMIYQKDNPPPVGGSNRYYQHFEYMFIFSKGKLKTFNPIKTSRRNKWNDKRTKRVKGFNRNKDGEFIKKEVSLTGDVKIGNVWKYIVGGGSSSEYGVNHPAIFPLSLAYDHILSWSNENDIIFDPFMGSGTTLIAAKQLNRKAIGVEISKDYCEIAVNRLESCYRKVDIL